MGAIKNNSKVTPKDLFNTLRPNGSDAVNGLISALDTFTHSKVCMNWFRQTIRAIKNAARGSKGGCTNISTNVSIPTGNLFQRCKEAIEGEDPVMKITIGPAFENLANDLREKCRQLACDARNKKKKN